MFYNKNIMQCSKFKRSWEFGNGMFEGEIREKTPIPSICQELGEWIASDSGTVRGRFSLRTSSTLLAGVSRLYRQEVDLLLSDLADLDKALAGYKGIRQRMENIGFGTCDDDSSTLSTEKTPEQMMRQIEYADSHIHTPSDDPAARGNKRRRTELIEPNTIPARMALHEEDYLYETSGRNKENLRNPAQVQKNTKKKPKTCEKCSQTPFCFVKGSTNEQENGRRREAEDEIPYGVILVHPNQQSKTPSKIIVTNLNPRVKRLCVV